MELVEFGALSEELRLELEGDEQDPWDAHRAPPMHWRPKDRHVALRDDRGRLVASAGMLAVEVEAGGERFPVVGLGGVIVNQAYRGTGLSLQVVEAALKKAETLGPDFMLLFCHPDRTGLYRRFAFDEIPDEVLVEHEGGRIAMPMRTMWRALRPHRTWPGGPVVVLSPPF
jgi:predicted N-acetyltransferase YhbS